MTFLVTSAAGANGAGYGKILAFADDGKPIGVFGAIRASSILAGWGSAGTTDCSSSTAVPIGFSHSTATDMWCSVGLANAPE